MRVLAVALLPFLLADVVAAQERAVITGHKSLIYSIAFSPDGKSLAAGSEDKDGAPIKIWDTASGQLKTRLPEKTAFVLAVAFSPDGKTVASSSGFDGVVRLWDVARGTLRGTLETTLDKDDSVGTRNADLMFQVKTIAFSPDGKSLASASGKRIRLWELGTGRCTVKLDGHPASVSAVAFSPDGKYLASAGIAEKDHQSPGTLKLWDVAKGQEVAALSGHTAAVDCVAFSPDGKTLASGDWQGKVRIWDVEKRLERSNVAAQQKGRTKSLAFSPNGKTLATAGDELVVRLWDVASAREVAVLKGHTSALWTVAFAPDGKTLASAGHDQTIRLWDVKDRP